MKIVNIQTFGRYFSKSLLIVLAVGAMAFAVPANSAGDSPNRFSDEILTSLHSSPSFLTAPFSVLVVNTPADGADMIPGDGFCDDGFGGCSLRAAIEEANAMPGANTIDFNISGGCDQNIQPSTALPVITETVTINGYSQPGALPNTASIGSNATICITLNGASVGGFTDGLTVNAVNSMIRGLNIIRWTDAGIEIGTGNGSVVEGNFIGGAGLANRLGVSIFASGVLVGGSTLVSRNIIIGNTRFGVAMTEPASNNFVQNNYIGLDSVSNPVGNGESGVSVFRSSNNTIGGLSSNVRNLISSNGQLILGGLDGSGISVLGDIVAQSPGNKILGNYIGTDPNGTFARPNMSHGIRIFGAIYTSIGGGVAGSSNLISGNTFDGVNISGSGAMTNTVRGNTIGLDIIRTNDLGNNRDGVAISGVPDNTVGGSAAGEGNWIAGNNQFGVQISGAGASNNAVAGNMIGFNFFGAARPQADGVRILSSNNIVGGTTVGARNYIAGHPQFGIAVAFSSGNQILGNHIGLTNTGNALGNANGVFIQDATNNTVGGINPGSGNVISNNNFGVRLIFVTSTTTNNVVQGNMIGTDPSGMNPMSNSAQGVLMQGADNNTVGGTTAAARNIISGNFAQGVSLQNGSKNNVVQGNYIGTKADGLSSLQNQTGIGIDSASSTGNVIGGTATGAGNLISGNLQNGIQLSALTNNNRIEGNIVGLNANGNAAIPNSNGISLFDRANTNTIGGSASNAGNVISGNLNNGVVLNDGANTNQIAGNKIGTDPTGMVDLGNGIRGVEVLQGSNIGSVTTNNVIGGLTTAERNIISGNNNGGVRVSGSTTTSNVIAGNFIGPDATGDGYLPNAVFGVRIEAPQNTVGGPTQAHRNVISGQIPSTDNGIVVSNTGLSTLIQNNYIGTNADGDDYLFNGIGITCSGSGVVIDSNLISGSFYGALLGNVGGGEITNNKFGTNASGTALLGNGYSIYLIDSSGVKIGEDAANNVAPNIIAGGTRTGISITGSGSTNNLIRQNSIYDNAILGIDLGNDGVTQNDPGDTDLANNQQNFPVINSVTTTIDGSLNSNPFRTFRIEFFNSTTGDPSGYGEGKTFITSTNVTTDGSGNVNFSLPNPIPIGGFISATATDLITNDTSEFSAIKQVLAPTAVAFNGARATHYAGRGNLVEWQTGLETDNLGFNVYRETEGKRQLVTPNLVAGSALITSASMLAEQNYTWFDADAPSDATYSIESIDLAGERDASPAFAVATASGRMPDTENSPTFRDLNSTVNGVTREVEETAKSPAKPTAQQTAVQSVLSGLSGSKVLIRNSGYYRVLAADLLANGLASGSDPRFLRMFSDGVEQPILVNGAEDGRLDPADSIEFYGIGADTAETAEHVYYVTTSTEPGLRIQFADLAGGPSNASAFMSTVERKDRSIYVASLLNGDEENFFGSIVNSTGVDQTITLPDLASVQTAEILVRLQGISKTQHHVLVELNGQSIGTIDHTHFLKGEARVSVDATQLVNGVNTIRLTSFGGASDVSVVDRLQVRYPRLLKAVNGSLRFSAIGGQSVTVGGFVRKGTRMFDVTDPSEPVELSVRMARETDPTGDVRTFVATATPIGSGTRSLIAIEEATPANNLIANFAANLTSVKGADLVVITTRDLFDSMQPLVVRRRIQGLKVELVDVADIYDEYNFGVKSSYAVRQFLGRAYATWRAKPRFVMFAGDASYDQKAYLGETDILQTRLVDTLSMETASDEWFGDLNDDGVAEMAIGRLPASSASQMNAIVAKILAYDQQSPSTSATFVSDQSDGFDFANVNVRARQTLPQGMSAVELSRDGTNDAIIHSEILSAINSGQRLISYSGHGSTGIWRGNIFTRFDADGLTNAGRLPVFLAMTCLNGFSHHPSTDSLSESLLKNPNGGAIAVWASSGTTLPDSYESISREIHMSLLAGQTLGEAHLRAKRLVFNSEVRQTWMLFGDPSMKLR